MTNEIQAPAPVAGELAAALQEAQSWIRQFASVRSADVDGRIQAALDGYHFKPSPAVQAGTARDSDKQLMDFYSVESLHALIDAQEEHVRRLQEKLPTNNQPAFTRVREG